MLHDTRRQTPFDLALERGLYPLPEPDRRLAHELAAGVLRQRTALDDALAPHVAAGLDGVRPDVLDILRIGAYQVLFLERVPPHAAVGTAVALARRIAGARVGAFVNAVLRKVAEGARTQGRKDRRPTDYADYTDKVMETSTDLSVSSVGAVSSAQSVGAASAGDLAARWSHPEWLVARWVARFGVEETERLLAWNNTRPALVIQPARWTLDAVRAELDAHGIRSAPAAWNTGLAVEARKPDMLPGFLSGAFIVQDPAQALVVRFFAIPAGEVVFDACAAPGGKAIALSASARAVVAADRRLPRVFRLRTNARRAALGSVYPTVADAAAPPLRVAGAVLLDVPCLGTGAFARHPDARWRVTERALARLAAQAAEFLRASAEVVRPGGLLCFATCSLEPEENEEQIAAFLAADSRYRRDAATTAPGECLTPAGDLMILPHRHGTDGAYAARLRRVA